MKSRILGVISLLWALSACVSTGDQQVHWDSITGSNQVAKVNGIKTLMQPGFY